MGPAPALQSCAGGGSWGCILVPRPSQQALPVPRAALPCCLGPTSPACSTRAQLCCLLCVREKGAMDRPGAHSPGVSRRARARWSLPCPPCSLKVDFSPDFSTAVNRKHWLSQLLTEKGVSNSPAPPAPTSPHSLIQALLLVAPVPVSGLSLWEAALCSALGRH